MRQLALAFDHGPARTADALRRRLEAELGEAVDLVLTENRTSVLTFQRDGDRVRVRLQRVFLEAPDDVIRAVVAFVKRPRPAPRAKLLAYFASRPDAPRRAPPPPRREPPLEPRGRHHDLRAIFDDLNVRYFAGEIRSRIGWGAGGRASRNRMSHGGRSIRFGAYFRETDTIRIHPALDADWVPRFFVESIVYHEMLHAAVPIVVRPDGRHSIHPPEFQRRERLYFAHEQARRWERDNLARLLAARG